MKKRHITGAFCAGMISLGMITAADAALLGRLPATAGGTDYQAYYDTTLDITWVADTNLALSNTFGLPYNTDLGMHPSDSSPRTYANTILLDGRMVWGAALHWIDAMNNAGYLGISDWRLPDVDTNCYGFNCTGSEMGSLFYNTLGVAANASILTGDPVELAKFTNLLDFRYWSGVEVESLTGRAWTFGTGGGAQIQSNKFSNFISWAVRSGDVGAVPVPAAVWLFGSGLVGLLAVARRRVSRGYTSG